MGIGVRGARVLRRLRSDLPGSGEVYSDGYHLSGQKQIQCHRDGFLRRNQVRRFIVCPCPRGWTTWRWRSPCGKSQPPRRTFLRPSWCASGSTSLTRKKSMRAASAEAVCPPTVVFNCGPGRSLEAKNMLMNWVTEILSENLGCGKRDVRCHLLDRWEGSHLMIDGKPKDFSKKVKQDALHVQHSDAQRQA